MEYTYLKNSTVKPFNYFAVETNSGYTGISDFRSLKIDKIKNLLNSYPQEYFSYIDVSPNVNMEKLSLDIYDNPNYFDLIFLVNDGNPIFSVPYDYDNITQQVNHKIELYEKKIGRVLPEKVRQRMYDKYEAELLEENNKRLEVKYIKPEKLYEVISDLYDYGLLSGENTLEII